MTVQQVTFGPGSTVDRAEALCEAVKDICYELGDGMSLAAVIGVLEIAKIELLRESEA